MSDADERWAAGRIGISGPGVTVVGASLRSVRAVGVSSVAGRRPAQATWLHPAVRARGGCVSCRELARAESEPANKTRRLLRPGGLEKCARSFAMSTVWRTRVMSDACTRRTRDSLRSASTSGQLRTMCPIYIFCNLGCKNDRGPSPLRWALTCARATDDSGRPVRAREPVVPRALREVWPGLGHRCAIWSGPLASTRWTLPKACNTFEG